MFLPLSPQIPVLRPRVNQNPQNPQRPQCPHNLHNPEKPHNSLRRESKKRLKSAQMLKFTAAILGKQLA